MARSCRVQPRTLACVLFLVVAAGPAAAQRSPAEIVSAVVGLQAVVPPGARTAAFLGTERNGSGVVIDDDGLVLTIGYLILEASSVSISAREGPAIDARIVAYDHATGFGLVRATEPLGVPPLELGSSGDLEVGEPVLAISSGGVQGVRPARVVDRRDFAGYWEYLLEDAIFVSPPHPFFGGSGLIGADGRLLGIGSLIVGDALQGEDPAAGNMFVPIDALKPILDSLKSTGRDPGPPRPWIGVYTEEYRGNVFITRVAEGGPAMAAGVRADDVILQVAGEPVTDMSGFLRAMWGLGEAGVSVPLTVLRGSQIVEITVPSVDRYSWLKIDAGRAAASI